MWSPESVVRIPTLLPAGFKWLGEWTRLRNGVNDMRMRAQAVHTMEEGLFCEQQRGITDSWLPMKISAINQVINNIKAVKTWIEQIFPLNWWLRGIFFFNYSNAKFSKQMSSTGYHFVNGRTIIMAGQSWDILRHWCCVCLLNHLFWWAQGEQNNCTLCRASSGIILSPICHVSINHVSYHIKVMCVLINSIMALLMNRRYGHWLHFLYRWCYNQFELDLLNNILLLSKDIWFHCLYSNTKNVS